MTPALAYARVSSDEQAKAGFSIPYQRNKVDEYARVHEFGIAEWFVEAHSAKEAGRPQFEVMVRYLEQHPDVRTILVHKLDRLCRNLTDWATLRERLKVRVVVTEEPVADTPLGRLTQTFGAGMARFYVENLSQEVLKGLRAKFEAGGFNTRAPVGYRNVPRTKTQKASIVVDPERAPLIVQMFERYATGHVSLADLSSELFDLGLRTKHGLPIGSERVRALLHHPFYKGMTVYQGEVREGIHEPIIRPELWDHVQEVLTRRHRDAGDKGSRFFLLRGLLYCGACGRRMTAEEHPRGSYYRCMPDARRKACGAPLVPVAVLDAQVVAQLAEVRIGGDHLAQLLAALDTIDAERLLAQQREESGICTQLAALEAKVTKLTDGFASGLVPEAQYRQLVDGYRTDAATRRTRLAFLTGDLSQDVVTAKALLKRAESVPALYALACEPEERKALLRQVFARIEVTNRAITRIEYHPPFSLFVHDACPGAGSVGMERQLLDFVAHARRA